MPSELSDEEILRRHWGRPSLLFARLPSVAHETSLDVDMDLLDLWALVGQSLETSLIDADREEDNSRCRIRAWLPSGWLGLNPAVATVTAVRLDRGRTRVTVRAVAKEGLVKQHAGRRAAESSTNSIAAAVRARRAGAAAG